MQALKKDAESRAAIVSRVPLGRPGIPADVEGIIAFLATDEGSYATGSTFRPTARAGVGGEATG